MSFTFGAPKTTASTSAPTLGTGTPSLSFGTGGGDTKTGSPASSLSKLLPPATGFTLGSAPTTASTAQPLSGFTISTATLPPASAAAPTLQFNLPASTTSATPAVTAATASSISTTSTSAGGLSFGIAPVAPAATTTTSSSALPTLPAASTSATTIASTTSAAPTFSLGSTATPTSAATAVTPATGGLTFTQLADAIVKWNIELEEQDKMFMNQALQLNAWDRLLTENGQKIFELNANVEKIKQQQQQLEHELDFVMAQQKELEDSITPLEKELKNVQTVDHDRNQTYQLAESLDSQLKQMSEDLKEIIEHLNETNKSQDSSDPVAQIGRILNAHMNSLQWIDRNTAQISAHLDQIVKMHDIHRREQERSLHLTYEQ